MNVDYLVGNAETLSHQGTERLFASSLHVFRSSGARLTPIALAIRPWNVRFLLRQIETALIDLRRMSYILRHAVSSAGERS